LWRRIVHTITSRQARAGVEAVAAVRLRTDDAGVELLVADDGPGVPAGDVERIFEPFVKLDPARGHRRGYGLGLNLCRRVVEAHRGSIEVLANPGGGTVVRVVVPRFRASV
jgi:signal transduction histidine kinase